MKKTLKINNIKSEIAWTKRDFKKDHDISFKDIDIIEIEDMDSLTSYDVGYINGLQSALNYFK